jgi:hypothetical protein
MEKRSRVPVAFGVFIGLLLPFLYLVQLVVQRTPDRQQWLSGDLEVILEDQAPMTLSIALATHTALEAETAGDGPLQLAGSARLRQAVYPWESVPFEARLALAMDPTFFEGGQGGGWTASYTERLVSREDGLGLPPIPCEGDIQLVRQGRIEEDLAQLQSWTRMELNLNLACTSAGPDLLWNSGDEQSWAIRGPLILRNRPI